MGLMVHSIARLPRDFQRNFYVYLLDYGWKEPLGEAMLANFERMAQLAAQSKAVVIRGLPSSHFADEVLSWHSFNGQDAHKLLPAILITTRHPQDFRESRLPPQQPRGALWSNEVALLIPLQRCCQNATDVAGLIDQIFADIAAKRPIVEFSVVLEMRAGHDGALVDALIIEPSRGRHGTKLHDLVDELVRSAGVRPNPTNHTE